jgi:hypothetical protein
MLEALGRGSAFTGTAMFIVSALYSNGKLFIWTIPAVIMIYVGCYFGWEK